MEFHKRPFVTGFVAKDLNADDPEEKLVWWYCGVVKNPKAGSEPKVLVCFRKVDAAGRLGDFSYRRVGITHLGQIRLGTFWRGQACTGELDLDTVTFQLDFSESGWQFYRAVGDRQKGRPTLVPDDVYLLDDPQHHDPSSSIQFGCTNSPAGLLVPCLEFFSRCYGRSQYIRRILSTYPAREAIDRFFVQDVEPSPPGVWSINLHYKPVNGDTVFLAHLKHDSYTQLKALSIWSQIEGQQGVYGNVTAFPEIGPWFQGPAQLQVKGLWIEPGKRFLGLQIVGGSDPRGVPIYRDRQNTNLTGPIEEEGLLGIAWSGVKAVHLKPQPDILAVTSDQEPDADRAIVDIFDPDFVILGEERKVKNIHRSTIKNHSGEQADPGEPPETYSGGEAHGKNKGVGSASFQAKAVMESHGALRDVWDVLLKFHSQESPIIKSVEFYTFENGFSCEAEPHLISFQPFSDEDDVDGDVRRWPFIEVKALLPRGALVARVVTEKGSGYIFEMQRKVGISNKKGKPEPKEDSLKGLSFKLDDERKLVEWLRTLMDNVRHSKGKLERIKTYCPGKADTFKHTKHCKDTMPCEHAVLNGLEKIGLV